jgi:hypothetical protein
MLGCFSLLLKLVKVQGLQLAEFSKVLIELHNCPKLLPDQITVQKPDVQSFDSFTDNLVIRNFRSLGFQL